MPPVLALEPVKRAGRFAAIIAVAIALIVVGGVVFAIVKVTSAIETAVEVPQRRVNEAQRRAQAQVDEAMKRASDQIRQALEQVPPEVRDKANTQIREALEQAESSETAEAPTRAPKPKRKALPLTPRRARVVAKLARIDLSSCSGTGRITAGIRVGPNGEAAVTTLGPMDVRGPMVSCVRQAVKALRFEPSQRGLEVRHEFVAP